MDILDKLANNGNRFAAYLLDIIPIVGIVGFVFYVSTDLSSIFKEYLAHPGEIQYREPFIEIRNQIRTISFLVWVLYSALMEASSKQATLGKQAMKIKVVDQNGERLSLFLAFKRNGAKIISFFFMLLGFIWILFDRNRQGWHDKAAKTFVVDQSFQPEA
jgi:uncharacterized RDD family membrane protein YckC